MWIQFLSQMDKSGVPYYESLLYTDPDAYWYFKAGTISWSLIQIYVDQGLNAYICN